MYIESLLKALGEINTICEVTNIKEVRQALIDKFVADHTKQPAPEGEQTAVSKPVAPEITNNVPWD